ncbi:rhodanese-like domain-containing protein [Aliifodinibius salicampi]|uniref:Rhodanese-like domain-containing protein n=1 Tax=Fodinibius salicampi TaxID=1920655 RepID=A0ABT3Q290_9BACT|nr:rhodanese-like domain-containing protein [Fodinibius salicampi]MCW9714201.1 rhodanese-like domain-containing protein [Fodinibius salicampi]
MIKHIARIGLVAIIGLFIIQACGNGSEEVRISSEEFEQKYSEVPGIVIDVRTQDEYDEGHLAVTDRHHDLLNGDFEARLDSLDKNKTYYLYCRSGNRSGQAAKLMIENGFENVYNIGGFEDLVAAGLESKK